ncbi:MAG: potassium transporter, partial [Bacteroidota bacterium]
YELIDLGIGDIYRESLDTSVKLAVDVLAGLGHRRYTAVRQGQNFLQYDEASLSELTTLRSDMKKYIIRAREHFELQEELLSRDLKEDLSAGDHAWDSDQVREGFKNI